MNDSPRRGRPRKPTPDGRLADKLRDIAARAQRNERDSAAIRERREELIREALAAGWPHREIAKLSGLSYQRVSQIARKQIQTTTKWGDDDA